jgi:hypothetical protein
MKKLLTDQDYKNILSLHKEEFKKITRKKKLFEQSEVSNTGNLEKILRDAEKSGCLSNGKILTNQNRTRFVYRATTSKGKIIDFYPDMTYKFQDGSKSGRWECPKVQQQPEGPKQLNQAQIDVLAELKRVGDWSPEPVPSQFLIDNGTWEKANVADENDPILGLNYSKYFKSDYPKGYFVYRKKKVQQSIPGQAEKIEVTAESCKTSIESLFNHMRSPKTYPLSNEQMNAYISTAEMCAEPANRKIFLLRFGLDNKLDKIARKYGIQV